MHLKMYFSICGLHNCGHIFWTEIYTYTHFGASEAWFESENFHINEGKKKKKRLPVQLLAQAMKRRGEESYLFLRPLRYSTKRENSYTVFAAHFSYSYMYLSCTQRVLLHLNSTKKKKKQIYKHLSNARTSVVVLNVITSSVLSFQTSSKISFVSVSLQCSTSR